MKVTRYYLALKRLVKESLSMIHGPSSAVNASATGEPMDQRLTSNSSACAADGRLTPSVSDLRHLLLRLEISELKDVRERELRLAGSNAQARDLIKRKYAEKERELRIRAREERRI